MFQVEFQDLSNPQEDGQLRAGPPSPSSGSW